MSKHLNQVTAHQPCFFFKGYHNTILKHIETSWICC